MPVKGDLINREEWSVRTKYTAAVHSHSQGNPRLIDNLMTNALVLGAQMEKITITPDVILAAVASQNLG